MVRGKAREVAIKDSDLGAAHGIIVSAGISLAFWIIIGLLIWAVTSSLAEATPPKHEQIKATQTQEASSRSTAKSASTAKSHSTSTATAHAEGGQGGAGGQGGSGGSATQSQSLISIGGDGGADARSASADGTGDILSPSTDVTVEGDSVENNSTNVVLVPNNNTANCMRVYGLSFGSSDGAGAFGVPFRDASCDFEQAADDAAALGQHDIAWFWRCHKKNLYKQFQNGGDKKTAIMKCFNEMSYMLAPTPQGKVLIPEDEYQNLLMAQVQKEEVERVQDRLAQQENLIEALKSDHEDKDVEIERLKREAARLKAEQADQQKRDAARRAAALKAISKKAEDGK